MFDQICFTQLLWTLETNLPPKTDIFVDRLEPTTKRLRNLNTVICSCRSEGRYLHMFLDIKELRAFYNEERSDQTDY